MKRTARPLISVLNKETTYSTSPEVQRYAVELQKTGPNAGKVSEYAATRELAARLGESLQDDASKQLLQGLKTSMGMKVMAE